MNDRPQQELESGWLETDGTYLSDDEMEQKLLDAVQKEQDDPETALRILAGFYHKLKRWEDYGRSVVQYVRLSADERWTSSVLLKLGGDFEGRSDWKAAAHYYLLCLVTNPTEPLVAYLSHNNLAFCLIQLEKWSPAEAYSRSAIRMNPFRHNAHKNLGLALRGQKRFVESAEAFIVATEQAPNDGRALAHLHEMIQAQPDAFSRSPELLVRVQEL